MNKIKPNVVNVSFFLSILGLLDAIYLALIKLLNNPEMCLKGVGDCWTVNLSPYSSIYGIPISILGAIAYLIIIAALIFERQRPHLKNMLIKFSFGVTTAGFMFSVYLTYLELNVIHAICPFCVVSAILMTALFILNIFRLHETM
jgi:uncharacterized membrane protein